jgi:c-di-GMP-binding flagellar brake protein YcgR
MLAGSGDFMAGGILSPEPDARRKTARAMVNWRARLMVAPPRFIDASVVDVSEGGMGMHCDQRVREHQVYDFAVAVPNILEWDRHQVIQARAVVKSVVLAGQRFRLGVQWVAIPPAAKELIRIWVRGAASNAFAGMER